VASKLSSKKLMALYQCL
jgi:hypothetical protein